jgi:superfamily II DNA/RNA helicase
MAGRTGRSGRHGTAITFVRPKNNEVKRLATIADTLGVKFTSFLPKASDRMVEEH